VTDEVLSRLSSSLARVRAFCREQLAMRAPSDGSVRRPGTTEEGALKTDLPDPPPVETEDEETPQPFLESPHQDAEVLLDHEGRILDASAAYSRACAQRVEQIRGKFVWELDDLDSLPPGEISVKRMCEPSWPLYGADESPGAAAGSVAFSVTREVGGNEALRESHQLLQAMKGGLVEGVLITDVATRRYLYANRALCNALGYSESELRSMSLKNLHAPRDSLRVLETFEAAARGEPLGQVEIPFRRKDGSLVRFAVRGKPITFRGRPCLVNFFRDLTDSDGFRESEERFRTFMDSASDWMHIADEFGNFSYVNRAMARALGYPRSDLVGMHTAQVLTEETRVIFKRLLNELITNGQIGFETTWLAKGGREIQGEMKMVAVYDDDGHFAGTRGVFRDLTDRRRAEQERLTLREQLHQAQKMEAVGHLAGGMAHDFNNFLTVVRGYTDRISGMLPDEHAAIHECEQLNTVARNAMGLVRSLLTFSRDLPGRKEPLDLFEFVERADPLLRRVLPVSVKLVTAPRNSASLVVNADKVQLQQMLLNLAINARDAMPDGGELHVSLTEASGFRTQRPAGTWVPGTPVACLTVADTGTGMSPDVRQRVFDPFFTTKPRGQGTGLGLSIVHSIIADHSGSIDVRSEVGEGTTFSVILPCLSPGDDRSQTTAEVDTPRGRGELVLLAEDDPHVRGIVAATLQSLGYEVIQAGTGLSALAAHLLHRDALQLLILDLDLPLINGLDCLRQIRERGATTPAIVITGDTAVSSDRLDTRTYFLPKPFGMPEIATLARDALRSAGSRAAGP